MSKADDQIPCSYPCIELNNMGTGDGNSRGHRRLQSPDPHSHRSQRERRSEHRDEISRGSRRDKDESHQRRSHSPSPRRTLLTSFDAIHSKLAQYNVSPLSNDDYYIRATEFKAWLAESKGKYLDEIPSKDARHYFYRFVRRWNDGKLPDEYYEGKVRSSAAAAGSSSQTRHRWAFTTKSTYTKAEEESLATIRDTVDTLTNGESRGAKEARDAERLAKKRRSAYSDTDARLDEPPSRDSGWKIRPTHGTQASSSSANARSYAEAQLEREHRQDLDRIAQSEARRRARQDQRDEEEALDRRSATGRDRMLEKKRERAAVNRAFADRRYEDDGIEIDDRELYDEPLIPRSSSSRAREDTKYSGASKRQQARQEIQIERKAELQEKVTALKEKDRATMEMFKAMAKERFNGA
ncbi:uncharacterized protein MEPE_05105 [Melanopsichium pennsylvanicum]|uniref:Splicing arginine serine-rich 12 n=2 Tax=Melanopsichium pennsylvanicum TaxID=63383 RepID=A0AAJ4XR52_9BASI|nr:conserved hypothetical protein [Melanopsichium pennsylvanicum 4]SNX86396.1 uncharacterized protein MEPE_05105 [Melanopsichium pennsylvanicum]